MNCSKCNAWVPDDSAFCPECGAKVEAPAPAAPTAQVFCPNCGAAMDPSDSFCENCGTKVEPAPVAAPTVIDKIKAVFKKVPPKYLKLGGIAVAAVLVIVIVAIICAGGRVNNYALYIQDGEVQYADMPKAKETMEVTSDFASDVSNYYLSYMGEYLGEFFQLSADGKTLFYPDKVSDDGYTLYCRDISNSKKEPVKIESGMSDYYSINEKGTLVTYLKDGKLYQHNLKEKTKIASDVVSYYVSKDGKTLLYTNDDGHLYLKKGNKDAEKIASETTQIVYVAEDLSRVVYLKDDSLYTMKVGKDAEKISSDVDTVLGVYESGNLYYVKSEPYTGTYWDLIKDDYSDKESWSYEYYSNSLKESELTLELYTLYYYNGKESSAVAENVRSWEDYATESAVVVYSALDEIELPTISFTKYIEEYVYLDDEVNNYLNEECKYYVAMESTCVELGLDEVYSVQLTNDGKTVYVCTEYDSDDSTVVLTELTLNGKKIKSTEKLDEDVYCNSVVIYNGEKKNHVQYFKDVENAEGELYLDGTKIDDDVHYSYDRYSYYGSYGACQYDFENNRLFYFVDWDSDDQMGTLKYSTGKKATSVSDDVHCFSFTPDGQTLYLYDYSTSSYKGELYILNGSKSTKLADDVVAIIPVY